LSHKRCKQDLKGFDVAVEREARLDYAPAALSEFASQVWVTEDSVKAGGQPNVVTRIEAKAVFTVNQPLAYTAHIRGHNRPAMGASLRANHSEWFWPN
jgi:hypothetical protein